MTSSPPKIILILLSLLTIWVPIPFASNRPVFWSGMVMAVALVALLWAMLARRDSEHYYTVHFEKVRMSAIAFLLAMGWALIQLLPVASFMAHPLWGLVASVVPNESVASSISIDRWAGLDALLRFISYGMVFWLALQVAREREHARMLLIVVAGIGSLAAIYGLYTFLSGTQKVLWEDKFWYREALTSTFISRNSYAVYAALGVLAALALFMQALLQRTGHLNGKAFYRALLSNFIEKSLPWVAMIVLMLAALMLTQSRAGISAGLCGVLVFFLLFLSASAMQRHRRVIWPVVFGVLALFGVIAISGGGYVWERLLFNSMEQDLRPEVYRVTLNAISENPWYGAGLGNFEAAFRFYRDITFPLTMNVRVDHAHNSFLHTALELGVPATMLLVLAVGSLFLMALKGVWSRKRDHLFPMVAVAASVVVWLHALVDFGIEMPAVAFTYALLMGVGCAQSWSTREESIAGLVMVKKKERCSLPVWLGFLALSCVMLIGATYFFALALHRLPIEAIDKSLDERKDVQLEKVTPLYQNISTFWNNDATFLLARGRVALAVSKHYGVFSEEGKKWLVQARSDMERGLSLAPANGYGWMDVAYIRFMQNEGAAQVAEPMRISFFTGPYDPSLLEYRARLSMVFWPQFDAEMQEHVLNQIRALWRWKKSLVPTLLQTRRACDVVHRALGEEIEKEVAFVAACR